MVDISQLIGKTLTHIENADYEALYFHTSDDEKYRMYHEQSCCEAVTLNELYGDLEDLVGSPIIKAEKRTNNDEFPGDGKFFNTGGYSPESCTWTFYELATVKGSVTLRWYGESNGYYSEEVEFRLM